MDIREWTRWAAPVGIAFALLGLIIVTIAAILFGSASPPDVASAETFRDYQRLLQVATAWKDFGNALILAGIALAAAGAAFRRIDLTRPRPPESDEKPAGPRAKAAPAPAPSVPRVAKGRGR